MGQDPAFLLYSKDWLTGTFELHTLQDGVYIRLIAHQHIEGSLPTDLNQLSRISKLPPDQFAKCWRGFYDEESNTYYPPLAEKFEIIEREVAYVDGEQKLEQNNKQKVKRLLNRRLKQEVDKRKDHGSTRRIVGILGSLIKSNDLSDYEKNKIKELFDYQEFTSIPGSELKQNISNWFDDLLKQLRKRKGKQALENANANKKKNISKNSTKDKGSTDTVKKKGRFQKPTREQVEDYFKEIGVLAAFSQSEKFIDYFESVGWVIGKSAKKMKDWKAACRNWKKNIQDGAKKQIPEVQRGREGTGRF